MTVKKSEHLPAESMHSWTRSLNELWGTDIDLATDIDLVLDMVADLGGSVARPVGPLTAFIMGVAVGRAKATGDSHELILREYIDVVTAMGEELGKNALDVVS